LSKELRFRPLMLHVEARCKICLLMTSPGLGIDEKARLAALSRYSILDTLPEQIYDDVTALASLICGTPISLVSLVDADRQWFKSTVGVQLRETPRSLSFCAHTIGTARTLVVGDAQQDPRFMDNPAVVGDPRIRFYAGAPIVEPGGHVLGTVCVIDTTPRTISPIQIAALEALARHTMALMEMRRTIDELRSHN
jgi:two-component system, NtrC family, sensor kinase